MNIASDYSVHPLYMWGANRSRSTARSGGIFSRKESASSGLFAVGACAAKTNGRSAGMTFHTGRGSDPADVRQMRRRLRSDQTAQDAVVTVIDKDSPGRETAGTAEDAAEPGTKRIVNTRALAAVSRDREGGFMDLTGVQGTEEEDLLNEKFQYNPQEISMQIQRAKTSSGAGQAAVKATRKVLELKCKLAKGGEDTGEIQLALVHAKRIERVAKKKKRHLQLEELVAATQKRDDRLEKEQESQSSVSPWDSRDISEEKVTDELAELDRQQSEKFAAIAEQRQNELTENADNIEEMVASIDALLEKISGKEQQMLEESLEALELTGVVDPHMSEEDLKMLRIKHRNAERKDIVKADSDYFKEQMEHIQKKGVSIPAFAGAGQTVIAAYVTAITELSPRFDPAAQSAPAIDVQV